MPGADRAARSLMGAMVHISGNHHLLVTHGSFCSLHPPDRLAGLVHLASRISNHTFNSGSKLPSFSGDEIVRVLPILKRAVACSDIGHGDAIVASSRRVESHPQPHVQLHNFGGIHRRQGACLVSGRMAQNRSIWTL